MRKIGWELSTPAMLYQAFLHRVLVRNCYSRNTVPGSTSRRRSTGSSRTIVVQMAQFVADLWESVFTPGVSPTLLKATYGAFVMLVTVLGILLFFTRSIHVLALLVISFCLIGSLIWYAACPSRLSTLSDYLRFLQELEAAKAAGKISSKNEKDDSNSAELHSGDKKSL